MKKVFVLCIVFVLLVAVTPIAMAAETTVYVSVSVDGKLEVAAQPVTITELTVQAAIKSAHEAYYSGGESGYSAGIDPVWNMFMISKAWGVFSTPYVVVNEAPLGSDFFGPSSADTYPVQDGDNIILSISSDFMNPAKAIALTVSMDGSSATITATSWQLDFETFQYTSKPFAGAEVVDPTTGESLGTTDQNGNITVPAGGIVAVGGLAAIPVDGSSAATPDAAGESNAFTNVDGFGGFGNFGGGAFGGFGGNTFGGAYSFQAIETVSTETANTITYVVIGVMILMPIILAACIQLLKRAMKKDVEIVFGD